LNFTCNNCQKRYSIADEKVRGKTVKVRCKNCQSVISVEGPQLPLEESTRVVSLADVERLRAQERSLAEPEPAASTPISVSAVTAPPVAKAPLAPQMPWDDEPTRAAPLRAPASPWFVMVRSKQEGPLDEAGLRELIASGAVNGRSFFWQQGMADWKRGLDIPELAGLFAPPAAPEPPPPPPPLMDEPEPAPAPGRAARGAAARREPEPQAFMPEPEPPPEQEQPQQQAWAPEEPEQPQQQAWAPEESQQDAPEQQSYYQEPEARPQPQQGRRGQAANAGPLNDDQLFSDLDLPGNRDGGGADDLANGPGGEHYPEPDGQDPYAAQGGADEGEPPAPVEDKRRASVKKKAPAPRRGSAGKKVAASLLLLLVLLVGVPFVLDMTGVMPLRVKTFDAQGNPVEYSYFSARGASALADKLMGRAPPAPARAAPPAPAPSAPAQPEPAAAPEGGAGANAPEAGSESGAAAAPASGQQAAQDAAPAKAGEGAGEAKAAAAAPLPESPPEEEVERVVEKAQASFQECVKAELKKNPSFRGGKVKLTATVSNTGAVTEAALSPKSRERSPVGTCIRERAKGMVFSAFSGEDVDLEIEVDLSNKL
jgi:predicted Zn finger-like uncharacterized protein